MASAISFVVNFASVVVQPGSTDEAQFGGPSLRRVSSTMPNQVWTFKPRTFYLEGYYLEPSERSLSPHPGRHTEDPLLLLEESGQVEHEHFYADRGDSSCVPMAEWQISSYPNCNTIHEINLQHAKAETKPNDDETILSPLGEGWFRTTWKLDKHDESMVLKTLRIAREFIPNIMNYIDEMLWQWND